MDLIRGFLWRGSSAGVVHGEGGVCINYLITLSLVLLLTHFVFLGKSQKATAGKILVRPDLFFFLA